MAAVPSFRFLHAADLHIDSPLRGLEAYPGAPVERLREAPRTALTELVRLAIRERVAFVVLAGDLFDGAWRCMHTGLWTAGEFRKLEQAGIPVYLIRGNHDAASLVQDRLAWPGNVTTFPHDRAATIPLDGLRVALHGRSFSQRAVPEDLAADYPAHIPGYFNLGLLHTSFNGTVGGHDTYAPTTEAVLRQRRYDYWALGHIHQRWTIRPAEPYIGFPGNTQGRHAKETGPKGCSLVSVEAGQLKSVEFRATDSLRWEQVEIDLEPGDDVAQVPERAREVLLERQRKTDDRLLVARVILKGACAAHRQMAGAGGRDNFTQREQVLAEIRNQANTLDGVWVEKILIDTSPAVDLEQLRRGPDLLGDLLRDCDRRFGDESGLAELLDALRPLRERAPVELSEAGIALDDPHQLRRWLHQAEALLVSRLTEGDA